MSKEKELSIPEKEKNLLGKLWKYYFIGVGVSYVISSILYGVLFSLGQRNFSGNNIFSSFAWTSTYIFFDLAILFSIFYFFRSIYFIFLRKRDSFKFCFIEFVVALIVGCGLGGINSLIAFITTYDYPF